MAIAAVSADAVVKIGAAANSLTTISGEANGMARCVITPTEGEREIPGGGNVYVQSNKRKSYTFELTVDSNSITRPRLRGKTGTYLFFEVGPEGDSGGDPKYTGNVYLSSVPTELGSDEAIVFTISATGNGPLVEGTY